MQHERWPRRMARERAACWDEGAQACIPRPTNRQPKVRAACAIGYRGFPRPAKQQLPSALATPAPGRRLLALGRRALLCLLCGRGLAPPPTTPRRRPCRCPLPRGRRATPPRRRSRSLVCGHLLPLLLFLLLHALTLLLFLLFLSLLFLLLLFLLLLLLRLPCGSPTPPTRGSCGGGLAPGLRRRRPFAGRGYRLLRRRPARSCGPGSGSGLSCRFLGRLLPLLLHMQAAAAAGRWVVMG